MATINDAIPDPTRIQKSERSYTIRSAVWYRHAVRARRNDAVRGKKLKVARRHPPGILLGWLVGWFRQTLGLE